MAIAAELTPDAGAARAPPPAVLVAIALAGCAAGVGTFALAELGDEVTEPVVRGGLMVWTALPYVLAGLVAWWRRPASRLGVLMVVAGFVFFTSALSMANPALPYTVGVACDVLPAVVFMHVFLAFPSGRLEGTLERVLVAVGYVTAFGLQLVGLTLGGYGPRNLLALTSAPDAAESLLRLQLVVVSVVALLAIGILLGRRRAAGRPLRRSVSLLVDSFVLGLLMIVFLFLSAAWGFAEGDTTFETIRRVAFIVVGLAPVAFLVGLLHARLARSAVGELVVELRAEPEPVRLREALADALRDPSLTLAYWLPEFGRYADLDGQAVELPDASSGRAVTLIDRNGTQVAAMVHDPALEEEPQLLDAVTAAAGIALENARLHVELHARLDELRASRLRAIEAGQKERQRLERDLHDGAQQRLVALSLELGLLKEELEPYPDAAGRLDGARRQIAVSLAELRELASGIHPAVVTGHGLEVALEDLAARAQVPVRLTVEIDSRLPEQVEVAAYYLVSESLANIHKHAHAASASIEVRRVGGYVLVEVVDDGIGGADTERGSGLRGLADRVEALGGRLRVWSPAGRGTRVSAEVPCAS